MPFEKGNKLSKGRKVGSENKASKEARNLFIKAIEGESEHIAEAFKQLRTTSPEKYLNTLSKFASFVIPKVSEQTFKLQQNYEYEPFDIKQIFKVAD